MGAMSAAASELNDPRLNVIGQALSPRLPGFTDLVRRPPRQQPSSSAQAATFDLNIPGGPLGEVAAAMASATGASVTLTIDSIAPIYSPGVSGTLTLEQALRAALEGTNVVFRLTSATTAALSLPSVSESISVTGGGTMVASPRYTVPVREIPQTIEVISRAAMEAQGVTTLSEALRNVPGITLQAGEGGGASSTAGDMFNMRGFNASNSLFVDNVRDDGLISRDVFNLEQVEVFMGPTGSDVGRGTAAGYVNMQTKTPRLASADAATLTFGTAEQRRGTIDLNHPLRMGAAGSWLSKSAVRMNVLWQDSGVAGRDVVRNESKAIAPSLGLGIGTPTRVVASLQVLRQDNTPDYGIPGAAWTESQLAPTTVHATRPVDSSNYFGSPNYDYDHGRQNTALGRIEHDLNSRLTVSNQLRYNRTEREAVITTVQNVASFIPATETVTLARQGNIRENTITSNQTNLVGRFSTGRFMHGVTAGLEFAREELTAPVLGGLGVRAPVSIYSPNPNDPVADYAVAKTGAFSNGVTDTAALFVFDTVQVHPRVQVNGGLRFERFDTEYRSVDASNVTTVDESATDGLVSGKAGVVFRVRHNGNLYVSYGTTVTPPGSANFTLSAAPNNQNNPNVKPQQSSNFEVGSKWDLAEGRLSVNGAVFHTINKNVLYTVDAVAIPPIYNQDDKQRVDGITIGASGQITRKWQILASFGYLDTGSLTQSAVNNGRRLTLSPTLSGSLWTTYQLPKGFSVGGGLRATDEVFINAANTIKAPGYRVIDGLVEYAVNNHLIFRLNVYNLTDELYIRNVNNNGGRYNPGYPLTAQLTSVIAF
jgi:catecholate siderophore receptor